MCFLFPVSIIGDIYSTFPSGNRGYPCCVRVQLSVPKSAQYCSPDNGPPSCCQGRNAAVRVFLGISSLFPLPLPALKCAALCTWSSPFCFSCSLQQRIPSCRPGSHRLVFIGAGVIAQDVGHFVLLATNPEPTLVRSPAPIWSSACQE